MKHRKIQETDQSPFMGPIVTGLHCFSAVVLCSTLNFQA